jgi:hypothetical protein
VTMQRSFFEEIKTNVPISTSLNELVGINYQWSLQGRIETDPFGCQGGRYPGNSSLQTPISGSRFLPLESR